MILKGLEIGGVGANCYIIGCEETRKVPSLILAAAQIQFCELYRKRILPSSI